MIISRTPLRISFVGGGSDLPAYYRQAGGAVVSTTINQYIYITVNRKFDARIRASYSLTEMVDSVDELRHELIREALRLLGNTPEAWLLETIEVKELKTEFGPLSFKHTGFYNNRTLELQPGCAPPGGFLLGVGAKHTIKIDGKDATAKDGVLRIPSGTKRVELARPH